MSYGNNSKEKPLACLRSATVTFYLDDYKTKLGRGRAMDITLTTSKSISSKHAVIEIGQDGESATLKDLNSLNGTFVNNTRVHNTTCKLKSNDRIRFGCDVVSYLFEFQKDMQEFSPNRKKKKNDNLSPKRNRRAGKRNEYGESLDFGDDIENDNNNNNNNVMRSPQSRRGRRMRQDDLHGGQQPHDGDSNRGSYGYGTNNNDGNMSPDALVRAMSQARQDGERIGKWASEFDDMKRRLKQVEAKDEVTREFRAQARERLRDQRRARKRSRNRKDGSGGGKDDNDSIENDSDVLNRADPDADLLIYDSAEGFIRQRSPPRYDNTKSRKSRKDPAIDLEHDGTDRQRARNSRDQYDEENGSNRRSGSRQSNPGNGGSLRNSRQNSRSRLSNDNNIDDNNNNNNRSSRVNSRSGSRQSLRNGDNNSSSNNNNGELNRSNSRKSLNRSGSRQSNRSNSRASLKNNEDEGEEDEFSSRQNNNRRKNNLQKQKSATGNFAIADSLDEENYGKINNKNGERLSSTVNNRSNASMRRRGIRDSLDDQDEYKEDDAMNDEDGGVKVNKSNSSNRTMLGNDEQQQDENDDGNDPFGQQFDNGGGDQSMVPDGNNKKQGRGKDNNKEEEEEEEDDGDDPFGQQFDSGGGDQSMGPGDEEEEEEQDNKRKRRKKKRKKKKQLLNENGKQPSLKQIQENKAENENGMGEEEDDDMFGQFGNGGGDESMPPLPGEKANKSEREMAKAVKRGKTPATEEEDNTNNISGDQNDDDDDNDMFGQFGNGGGDEAMPEEENDYEMGTVGSKNKNFATTATFGGGGKGGTMIDYTNHSPSELIQEINRLKAQLSNRKGGGDIGDGKRIAELLSQNGQLRKELHATNINLEAAKAAVGVQSQNEEFVFRARRAAMRPIIKKWRSAGIGLGFRAFKRNCDEASNREGKEAFVQKRRMSGAKLMYKTLQRAFHARLSRGWNKWHQNFKKIQHAIDKEIAIKEALAVSSDKAKARGLENYCRALQTRLEEATDVNRQQAETLEDLEGLDWPRKLLEQKQTVEQLYGQLNEIREQAEGERESFAKALREIKTAGPASAKAQIQNFITAQSRQVMLCKQQIREYERRHEVSARAWSELEQEKESLAAEVDFLRKEALEQAVSWRDMLSARDKRLVYLEDKLATLAGYGSSAKKAAAQVLVRELHDMRRETADFLDRLQRRVDTQQISPSKQQNSKNNKTGTTTTTSSSGRARETVMESRVTTLQNELRQLTEEGSVARVVQAQEAARMARVDAATHLSKSNALNEEIKVLRKEMAKMIDPSAQKMDMMDEEEDGESIRYDDDVDDSLDVDDTVGGF